MPDNKRSMIEQDNKIGAWLSAAMEDPLTCQEMKDDINNWFNSFHIKSDDLLDTAWGEWNTQGYWFPNRILKMTACEQFNENIKNGYSMKLFPHIEREINHG